MNLLPKEVQGRRKQSVGRLAEERRERGAGGDTYFPRARLARGNFATRVFPKIYVCPCHRLTTSLACYGYYRALAFVRDASESYHPITVWPFRHLRDAIRKFLRRMFFPAESATSGISFQRRISLIFTRWSTPLRRKILKIERVNLRSSSRSSTVKFLHGQDANRNTWPSSFRRHDSTVSNWSNLPRSVI